VKRIQSKVNGGMRHFNYSGITVSTEQSTENKENCFHISLSFFDLMDKVYHLEGKWQPNTFLLHQPNGQYGCQRQDGYDKILSLA
jgi:hypothetical protein